MSNDVLERVRAVCEEAGVPEETITVVTTALAPSTLPADAIRQKDAEERYDLHKMTLSSWVKRGHVRQYEVLSHKMRFVSENDIRKRLGLEPLSNEA